METGKRAKPTYKPRREIPGPRNRDDSRPSCDASSRCAFLLANISVPRSVVFDELIMGQEDAFMYIASRSIFSEINKDITFPPSKIGFVLFLRNGDEEMKNFSTSNSKNSVEDTGMKLKHKERT